MSKLPLSTLWLGFHRALTRGLFLAIATVALFVMNDMVLPQSAAAYPFWAQASYPESPREATGRIVCANCHLAAKPTQVEIPQSVLPDTVFEAVVKVPYDTNVQQVLGDGSRGPLNVGAVLMLPEGFKIAPPERLSEEMVEKTAGLFYQPYSEDQENVVIVGPLPGDVYQELVFPVLSPNPATQKGVYFGKYSVHVGGNRGRGQVYPTGGKSNNAVYNAEATGTISQIAFEEEVGYQISIQTEAGEPVEQLIPPGPELIVAEGQAIATGEPLTNNPNVGGFGQADSEIVLQSPNRILGLLAFFGIVSVSQTMLVLKKKQIEKVQASEMNF